MKETDLRDGGRVMPVAIAATLGMAGIGLLSERVVMADVTTVTDTLSIKVEDTCTFKNTSNETYIGSALNGSEVDNFKDGGVHTFYLFCNSNDGYTVSATPYDLEATGGIQNVIAYTNQYSPSGKSGMWTAAIASSEPGVTVTSPVPVGGGVIISSDTNSSASASFTATYSAYVGSETPAGTYTGRIEYILSSLDGTANSGSNGSDSGSGSGSGNGANSGTDANAGSGTTNDAQNNNDSDKSSQDDVDSNKADAEANSGETTDNTQSVTSQTLNSTYNTYSTTNTYNTTNYAGGSSTPVATGTQLATSGNTSGMTSGSESGTTSSNSGKSGTSDSYEKPLGVTTNTTSSKEDSGVDPAPMIAAGVALAAAGVAVVALTQSKKKEEE